MMASVTQRHSYLRLIQIFKEVFAVPENPHYYLSERHYSAHPACIQYVHQPIYVMQFGQK